MASLTDIARDVFGEGAEHCTRGACAPQKPAPVSAFPKGGSHLFYKATLNFKPATLNLIIRGMNILITGGAGFIGSHVCERLLNKGHAVWTVDDLNSFYSPEIKKRNLKEIEALGKPFTFVPGDLCDAKALARLFAEVRFDQVVHL